MVPGMTQPAGVPKEEFLQSVRRALGRSGGPPHTPYPLLKDTADDLQRQVGKARRRIEADRAQLMDRLAQVAALQDWNVHRAQDPEDAIGYILSLASRLGVTQIVRTSQEVFSQIPLDQALAARGVSMTTAALEAGRDRGSVRAAIIEAGIGITGADYAVAETGSVVLLPRRGLSRLASVIPPVHIALIRPEDLVDTLDDVFLMRRLDYHQNGGEMGSYLNFITGPSRTADIEQTLVIGVHGPREVHMVLLG
jgi:L-lactate dehydrogenase complex protein LldG